MKMSMPLSYLSAEYKAKVEQQSIRNKQSHTHTHVCAGIIDAFIYTALSYACNH